MNYFVFYLILFAFSAKSSEFTDYAYNSQLGQTDVLIGIKNDKIIFEEYRNGFSFTRPHKLHSLSKLYLSLFIAREEFQNRLNTKTAIFPNSQFHYVNEISIESLLRMSSGLRTIFDQEAIEKINFGVIRPIDDFSVNDIEILLNKSLPNYRPNTSYNYSFLDNNLLLLYLHHQYSDLQKSMNEFLYGVLRLKTTKFAYTTNPQNFLSSDNDFLKQLFLKHNRDQSFKIFPSLQFAVASPEDLITVANIFKNNGKLYGQQIISPEWQKRSWSYNPKNFISSVRFSSYFSKFTYGMYWFLNKPFLNGKKPYPYLPDDLVLIQGLRGQTLAIFPSQNAIYLRLANDPLRSRFDRGLHLKMFYDQFLK